MKEEKLLTPAAVARMLMVSRSTVSRYFREGRLPGLKYGGKNSAVKFRPSDVKAFLDASLARTERA